MAKFIKSYSNFVKEVTHQYTKDGTILEREWTTVGGKNDYTPTGPVLYQSANFIVEGNDYKIEKYDTLPTSWLKNVSGETEWTMEDVENCEDYYNDDDYKIKLNDNIYDLRDFAYYGSCTELIKGSINDILKRFPGELYVTHDTVTYFDQSLQEYVPIGKNDNMTCLVSNPFKINIHDQYVNLSDVDNSLRYFANGGYYEYEVFVGSATTGISITGVDVVSEDEMKEYQMHDKITLKLNDGTSIIIGRYVSENCSSFIYLTSSDYYGYHIRPKNKIEKIVSDENIGTYVYYDRKYYDNFISSLDSFQKILLNPDTDPKYKMELNVLSETDYGTIYTVTDFVFPTDKGDYNIGNTYSFNSYLTKLSDIGTFYDENYSDNLYRMMTHEPIKNFDWTYKRDKDDSEDDDDNMLGVNKICNIIRVYGREFDELRRYIKGITNGNNLSYDKLDNIPDYFITDLLETDGWDVKNIYPYSAVTDYAMRTVFHQLNTIEDIHPYGYTDTSVTHQEPLEKNYPYFNEQSYSLEDINTLFFRILRLNSRNILRSKGTIEGIEKILSLFGLKSKRWTDKYNAERNEKPDVYYGYTNDEDYDYDIKEYSTFMYPIVEPYSELTKMGLYDYYNTAKVIGYETEKYYNGIHEDYIGLPLTAITGDSASTSNYMHLYPYFDSDTTYDGSPYYQMNGGWMKMIPFDYDIYDETVTADEMYSQTLRHIKNLDSISDLFNLYEGEMEKGSVVYISNFNEKYIIIDNVPYLTQYETVTLSDGTQSVVRYFSVYVYGNSVTVGSNTFQNYITVSNYDKENIVYSLDTMEDGSEIKIYVFDSIWYLDPSVVAEEGSIVEDKKKFDTYKLMVDYAVSKKYIYFSDDKWHISSLTETFETSGDAEAKAIEIKLFTEETKYIYIYSDNISIQNILFYNEYYSPTHYYKLMTKEGYNQIGNIGWKPLMSNDEEYKNICRIVNYNKGNNPHNAATKYDDGYEYLSYFYQIFKYPLENNLFDSSLFDNSYANMMSSLSGIGFININVEKDDVCDKTYKEIEDDKIHIYADTVSEEKDTEGNSIITLCGWLSGDTVFSSYTRNVQIPDSYGNTDVSEYITATNFDNTTFSVVNTKRVDICFRKKLCYDGTTLNTANAKYLLSIIKSYLSQMVPSNVICKFIFNS